MKIVNRETFLNMPDGTVYSKYEPCNFGELSIMGGRCGNDYIDQSITTPWFQGCHDSGSWFDVLDKIQNGEPSPRMDFDCAGRDGFFDADQLFAVWEKQDILDLIKRLLEVVV